MCGAAASRPASCSGPGVRTSRCTAVLLALVGRAGVLCAQDALNRVTPTTEVRSVDFRFVGKQSLDEDVLRQKIALTGQGRPL